MRIEKLTNIPTSCNGSRELFYNKEKQEDLKNELFQEKDTDVIKVDPVSIYSPEGVVRGLYSYFTE
jgi:hypothetical protein